MNAAEKIEETVVAVEVVVVVECDALAPAFVGLESGSARQLREAFVPALLQIEEWERQAANLTVTDESQTAKMELAGVMRRALKKVRVGVDKKRKELNADALLRTKAINAAAGIVEGLIVPLETHLLQQETFAERAEMSRKNALRSAREDALGALGADVAVYGNLGEVSDDAWSHVLDAAKTVHEAKAEAARHAEAVRIEAERIATEKREAARLAQVKLEAERLERERVQAEENARLRAENEKIVMAASAERELAAQARRVAAAEALAAKANADREAAYQADIAKTARDAVENEARAAREALDRAAREHAAAVRVEREKAELAANALAEVHAKAARARRDREIEAETDRLAKIAAAENAALAPDREKLAAFAAVLRGLVVPSLSTEKGQALSARVAVEIFTLAKRIEKAGASL